LEGRKVYSAKVRKSLAAIAKRMMVSKSGRNKGRMMAKQVNKTTIELVGFLLLNALITLEREGQYH